MIGMRGLTLGVVLWVVACGHQNPDYDPRSSGTSGSDPTDGLPTNGDSESGELSCEQDLDRPIGIALFMDGVRVPPDCSDPVRMLGDGDRLFEIANDRIVHEQCVTMQDGCGCSGGPTYAIEFGGTVGIPAGLPTCGPISLWAAQLPEGCAWAGVLVQAQYDPIPDFLAARTIDIPVPSFNLPFSLEPADVCEPHDCLRDAPGRYDLDLLGEIVPVEGSPHEVSIPIESVGLELPYVIDNRMSSVDPDCKRHVAWTALRNEP